MSNKYQALLEKVYETHDLEKAMGVLQWDKETNMPAAGNTARIQQMTTLRRIHHTLFTSDEMGRAIEDAAAELNGADYASNEASLIRYLRRAYDDATKLPADFVKRRSEISGAAHPAWVKARADNNYADYEPHMAKIIDLNRELAELYGYEDELYDPLFDKYELGMKTADVRAIFNAVKTELKPLLDGITAHLNAVDDSIVHQNYPIATQQEFARYIAAKAGYDFNRGHLGTVVHPFATSFSRNDSRITTRWNENFLNAALFGTLHESGHGMYEQGTGEDLARTPLARGTSSGIHESQSRMIENVVGRSYGFWKAHFPKLQSLFPEQLGNCSVAAFYRAVNKVHPSYIRVEADELTYAFHIILRFELEQEMLNGDVTAATLPEAWGAKLESLLGIVPPTDTLGCLQDIHWTSPSFGYFPTYALGNLYAAQFYETAVSQNPTIAAEMANGETTALLSWLIENIHQHGRKFTPSEIVEKATGQPLSHEAFVRYAQDKFGKIYNL